MWEAYVASGKYSKTSYGPICAHILKQAASPKETKLNMLMKTRGTFVEKTKQSLALCVALSLFGAGCATQQQQQQGEQRTTYGWTQQQQRQAAPEPGPAPAPKPAPKATPNEATLKTDLASLTKSAPASASLGETFQYELRYTTHENLDSLVITDKPGDGVTYVKSEPAATVDGRNLVWNLKDLDKGQSGSVRIWVKADKEGTLANCATLVAVPKVCVGTFVGKAQISIEKTGPAQAVLNSDVTYNIVVKNTGSLPARDVVVTDTLPQGLTHSSGQRTLTFNVGELGANQSRQIPVTLKATAKGKHCNVAAVTTSNAGKASSEACTTVLVPGLKVIKTGTKEQFLLRNATYEIKVTNTGDTPLTGVVVTDSAPGATTIVSASAGGTVSGNTVTWNVGELAAGAEKTYSVVLTSKTAGNHCNSVTVATAQGLRESSEACTLWRGVSALLLEKADNPDPIQVGENTTYTVKVTNQGTADDTNVKMVVEFPAEIDPVSASNGGTVNGKTVTFPAYPRLAPKQAFEYTIVARGARAGDARVKFVRTSDGIPAPTSAEESTRVY